MRNTVVLEPSTNTHTMEANSAKIVARTSELGGMVIETGGIGVVLHGEHGVICTESEHVIKLVQQECNPLTGMMQNAFD